jgi:hypothetical protein
MTAWALTFVAPIRKPGHCRRLCYFDKWAVGISTSAVEDSLTMRNQIERRLDHISARLEAKP